MLRIGFMASGRGSNFQAIVDAMERGEIGAAPALLVVDDPAAYAIERARAHGIEHLVLEPRSFGSKDEYFSRAAEEFKSRGVGLVVLAGFMRVVRRPLLAAFPMRVINIHPALLPAFPGLHGQGQALDHGVRITGCTVHFVDEGVDTGPIIIQAAVPVLESDTEETLSERILKQEHRIFPLAVRLIAEGRVRVEGRAVRISGIPEPDASLAMLNPPEL